MCPGETNLYTSAGQCSSKKYNSTLWEFTMLNPQLPHRKVILKNNFCAYKFDIPKNNSIVPTWKVRILYHDFQDEEYLIDIVTYQNNNLTTPYKILNNSFLRKKSSILNNNTNYIDIRMEEETTNVHIYAKTIKDNIPALPPLI